MPAADTFVLDSYAIIGYLQNEPFADTVQRMLHSAKKGRTRLLLHALNLGEVYYITAKKYGHEQADLAYSRIKAFPLVVIDQLSEGLLLTAASLKARFPIAYADCFAAALAVLHDAALLTGDREFQNLENAGVIEVAWL